MIDELNPYPAYKPSGVEWLGDVPAHWCIRNNAWQGTTEKHGPGNDGRQSNKEVRSRMMSAVRAKNTKLELEIRHRLFRMGFRYRLHRGNLPGTPDLVFPKYRSIIFMHGCFWHYHGCHLSSIPATRSSWWRTKLEGNARRDSVAVSKLQKLGWRVLIIWECAHRRPKINRAEALDNISGQAADFLRSNRKRLEIPRLFHGQK